MGQKKTHYGISLRKLRPQVKQFLFLPNIIKANDQKNPNQNNKHLVFVWRIEKYLLNKPKWKILVALIYWLV